MKEHLANLTIIAIPAIYLSECGSGFWVAAYALAFWSLLTLASAGKYFGKQDLTRVLLWEDQGRKSLKGNDSEAAVEKYSTGEEMRMVFSGLYWFIALLLTL